MAEYFPNRLNKTHLGAEVVTVQPTRHTREHRYQHIIYVCTHTLQGYHFSLSHISRHRHSPPLLPHNEDRHTICTSLPSELACSSPKDPLHEPHATKLPIPTRRSTFPSTQFLHPSYEIVTKIRATWPY
ncbi:hypothetical protein K431DRAFT_149173 [Polychaeton citri CBS 116435]|uniref:Uncharacterized protein n=1 Tax=Polychaeton citri CBS 116435 TaxID=1314669 RepID=A0A9P4UKT7_9PEZI|nr:hypothetical protein K431DRAFT_149173 [Polychaeton citri CBS 116435]